MDSSLSTSKIHHSFFSFLVCVSDYVFACCIAMRNHFSNRKYLLELFKKISKFHEEIMSPEHALNFDQSRTIYRIYKPIRFRLWFVYKNMERNYHSFEPQKRYFGYSDKIKIVTWRLLEILTHHYFYELISSRNYSLQNNTYLPLFL